MPLPFPLSHQFGTLAGGLGCFPFDYEAYPPQSHSREARTRHSEFGWVRYGSSRPSPSSALPPRRSYSRRHLKAFRGEPAISGFDWHFTPTHNSSHGFSPPTSSGLHGGLTPLHPGHG